MPGLHHRHILEFAGAKEEVKAGTPLKAGQISGPEAAKELADMMEAAA